MAAVVFRLPSLLPNAHASGPRRLVRIAEAMPQTEVPVEVLLVVGAVAEAGLVAATDLVSIRALRHQHMRLDVMCMCR